MNLFNTIALEKKLDKRAGDLASQITNLYRSHQKLVTVLEEAAQQAETQNATIQEELTVVKGDLYTLRADLGDLLKPLVESQLEVRDAIREGNKLTRELHTKLDILAGYLADEKVRRP